MISRRALAVAAVLMLPALQPAVAQMPGQIPPPGQAPPCMKDFMALRDDTESKAKAVKAANDRKAPVTEACHLLTVFTVAEAKMLKYAKDNATWCGIPPQIVQQITTGHAQAMTIRNHVCQVAAAPARPTGPTLSDVLGGSAIPDASNIKSGRGTFDTLTGTPLGKTEK
jgi:hypothetical protein